MSKYTTRQAAWSHEFDLDDESGMKAHTYTAHFKITDGTDTIILEKTFTGEDRRSSVPELEGAATQWGAACMELFKEAHATFGKERQCHDFRFHPRSE